MPPRTIAIGDIHGCSRALSTLIDAIDLDADDLLVTLGDYIDRGHDSRGVLDQLIALRDRCRLVPILGNHDQMLLDARDDEGKGRNWLNFGGIATLDSYGGNGWLELIPPEHFAFLESCVDYFETDTHIFVHANYFDSLPMDEQPVLMLRWESLRDFPPSPHHSGKTVIVGHTSQKRGEILNLGYVKCIDTGCYAGRWLTALDVITGRVWQADEHGRLRVS